MKNNQEICNQIACLMQPINKTFVFSIVNMNFFLTISVAIILFFGLSYLSVSQWTITRNISVQVTDFEEDPTNELNTEKLELKESLEALLNFPEHSHIDFRIKLNRLFIHKETWIKHFVDEISTPPPES